MRWFQETLSMTPNCSILWLFHQHFGLVLSRSADHKQISRLRCRIGIDLPDDSNFATEIQVSSRIRLSAFRIQSRANTYNNMVYYSKEDDFDLPEAPPPSSPPIFGINIDLNVSWCPSAFQLFRRHAKSAWFCPWWDYFAQAAIALLSRAHSTARGRGGT